MKNLLYKEFRLALHPTSIIFLTLSAMLIIPNYPYYVTFFYTCLGIFFICLTGRENQDLFYMMLLPVRKRDIVRARIGMSVCLQCLQALICVPFAILRQSFKMPGNQVGMDANIAFFGLAFLMMGLFNLAFFTRYYANPQKIGKSFAIGSTVIFVYMGIVEAMTHFVPFFLELDTPDPENLTKKLLVLAVGIAGYAVLTLTACKKSEKELEKLDL
ncbi:MAG: ABC-2 transporter permease [Oscillibacter sp.]|jgi:hypothetical protein|nr:ABC-2 transporter permease [Oscillibacter sp.]